MRRWAKPTTPSTPTASSSAPTPTRRLRRPDRRHQESRQGNPRRRAVGHRRPGTAGLRHRRPAGLVQGRPLRLRRPALRQATRRPRRPGAARPSTTAPAACLQLRRQAPRLRRRQRRGEPSRSSWSLTANRPPLQRRLRAPLQPRLPAPRLRRRREGRHDRLMHVILDDKPFGTYNAVTNLTFSSRLQARRLQVPRQGHPQDVPGARRQGRPPL